MRVSAVGNGYPYYGRGYISGATIAAVRTATAAAMGAQSSPVTPVKAVPEVFSNAETVRVPRTPAEMEKERQTAYDTMTASASRSAEDLNAPLRYRPRPLSGDGMEENAQKNGVIGTDSSRDKEENVSGLTDEQMEALGVKEEKKPGKMSSPEECETCKRRQYVDGSNESDVSFKTPGHIDPKSSAAVVSAHEYQHVANAVQEGNKPGNELVSATVSLKTAICPECGTTYVAGGETRTTIRHTKENPYQKTQENFEAFKGQGKDKDKKAFNVAA